MKRLLPFAVALLVLMLMFVASAVAAPEAAPDVAVTTSDGHYRVSATFLVAQPASVAFAVLTDYDQIPRFMPDVRKSQVLERRDGRTVVEQEAVARLMMFSKRVHLVLEIEIDDAPTVIRFRDRCGKSFASYEGTWTIVETNTHTQISYQLTAKPTFDLPDFLLKRLLERDARVMIERLQHEMAARASRSHGESPAAHVTVDPHATMRGPRFQGARDEGDSLGLAQHRGAALAGGSDDWSARACPRRDDNRLLCCRFARLPSRRIPGGRPIDHIRHAPRKEWETRERVCLRSGAR